MGRGEGGIQSRESTLQVSGATRIRTDTTLDHRQKAELAGGTESTNPQSRESPEISVPTRIRTDTTLDHRQKAEKASRCDKEVSSWRRHIKCGAFKK